jgi:hypothetical protein
MGAPVLFFLFLAGMFFPVFSSPLDGGAFRPKKGASQNFFNL